MKDAWFPDEAEIRLVESVRGAIPSATMQRVTREMRDVPDQSASRADFPTMVRGRPRTTAEVARARPPQPGAAEDPRTFHASNGASFEAMLEKSGGSYRARYQVFHDVADGTVSTSIVRVFPTEAEALAWLDQNANICGFTEYPIDRRE
jgi:hypothetical protein